MIKSYTFTVTDNVEVLVKEDFACNVVIRGGNGILIGPKEMTMDDGFLIETGYTKLELKAADLLYVMSPNLPKVVRVFITEKP